MKFPGITKDRRRILNALINRLQDLRQDAEYLARDGNGKNPLKWTRFNTAENYEKLERQEETLEEFRKELLDYERGVMDPVIEEKRLGVLSEVVQELCRRDYRVIMRDFRK